MRTILILLFLTIFTGCHRLGEKQGSAQPLIFLHYWSDDMGAGIDTMMQAFSRVNHGYDIKSTGFDHESFKVSIRVMLAGGNPPDLFSYWAGARTKALVESGYLEPISDVWKTKRMDTLFSPMVSKACTYNGSPYVVPVTQHYVAFFYNKKMFSQFGLTPPKTWDEFLSVCQTFKKNGVVPINLGARDNWPAQFWFDYLLLRTAGADFRDSLMSGEARYSDKRVLNVFAQWKDLIDKGYFCQNPTTTEWSEASKDVASGNFPMILMGTWVIGLFDNQFKLKQGIDYDYFSFPVIDSEVEASALGPIDGILLPKSGNLLKTKKVISYFVQPEVQRAMSVGSGSLSPSLDVVPDENSPVQQRIHAELQKINRWEFNYDLATKPEVAELGLKLFEEFLESPESYPVLLDKMQHSIDNIAKK